MITNAKSEYLNFIQEELASKSRIVMVYACFIIAVFSYLDWITYPHLFRQFLILRFIWAGAFVIGIGFSYHPFFAKRTAWIIDAQFCVCAAVISYMIYLSDGYKSPYFGGLMLSFYGGYLANPVLVFPHHLIFGIVTTICYNIAIIAHTPSLTITQIIGANYFPLSSFIAVVVMGLISYQHSFKSYLNQVRLRQTTEELSKLHHQMEQMYKEASEEAKTDALTGCYNRRHFIKILERRVRSIEGTNASFYLAMLDLDHFKEINDNFGHPEGDKAIQTVAQAIHQSIYDDAVVCRYGGDEFLLMLDIKTWHACRQRLNYIIDRVKNLGKKNCKDGVQLDLSVGVTKISGENHNIRVDNIIQLADSALLTAKRTARGSIIFNEAYKAA